MNTEPRPTPETTRLLSQMRAHIAIMAPHQKERMTGKLLIEAAQNIEQLERERDEARESGRLLREQIRVADVAFNRLNDEANLLRQRVAELESQLAMANDAANKGDEARCRAGAMADHIDELEKDKKRLDWLSENMECHGSETEIKDDWMWFGAPATNINLRQAIDDAMKGTK